MLLATYTGLSARRLRILAGAGLAVLGDELAFAGELQDLGVGATVAADPDVPLVIHDDAMVRLGPLVGRALLWTTPAGNQVAGWIELEDRRGRVTALADARLRLSAREGELSAIQIAGIVAAMDEPDVVAIIDREADGLAEHPVVGHRLGPERINLELRRLLGLSRRPIEHGLADAETDEQGDQGQPNEFP